MERAGEVVAIFLNNVKHRLVIDIGCVNSRVLWIKLKFSWGKVCEVVGYAPIEKDGETRDRVWNVMDRILDAVGNRYRLCILGDLKEWHNWCIWSSMIE